MDPKTIAYFKKRLEAERQSVIDHAKNIVIEPSQVGTTGDEGDEAAALYEQHMVLRFKERDKHLLQKIHHALSKIKEGTFGECEDCGDEIGIKRLEIRPVATLCISCKEIEEHKEKSFVNS